MKLLLQVVVFVSLLAKATSNQVESPWHWGEVDDAFVPFPAELQSRLDNEARLYKSKSYPLPVLRVFETYPESSVREMHVWPQLKGMTKRLHPSFWPRVQYNVTEGLEFGCRKADPDSETGATLPITTTHCHRHCLHQGRYCLNETTLHSDHRRAALKEIVRRLCMDTIYHAKDPRYIAYLQQYDSMECLANPGVGGFRNCSVTAMEMVGIKYDHISSCVSEDKHDKDVPSDAMDRNLRQLSKYKSRALQLPFVNIDGQTIPDKKRNTNGIFNEYCSSFPDALEQPLACHACKHCHPVAECLWTLRCNNETNFDPKQIKPEVLNLDVDALIAKLEGGNDALAASGAGNDALTNNAAKAELVQKNQEGEGEGGDLFLILLGVLIVVALVTSFVYFYRSYQQERTQKLLSAIASGKYSDGTFGIYRDNPDSSLGGRTGDEVDEREHEGSDSELRTRAMALLSIVDDGISVRNLSKSIKEKRNSSSNTMDYLEDSIDELEKAATSGDNKKAEVEKELVVEDLLDDESEWANNKRGTGSALPATETDPIFC